MEGRCSGAGDVREPQGGVGKSTSSVYTALGLAAAGGRVLLVDADATNRTCLKWSSLAEDWPAMKDRLLAWSTFRSGCVKSIPESMIQAVLPRPSP